ncbi:MAG: PAS domain S-box protein [Polyangiaceae bacterium]
MPTILIVLGALSGFTACFALSNLFTWRRDELDHSPRYFGLICVAFATYLMLQLLILTADDIPTVSTLLRWQGVALAAVFGLLPPFGAAFGRRELDQLDFLFVSIYVTIGAWSLLNPSGYWFANVTALEPIHTVRGTLHLPRGNFSWTYYVSIVAQYPLLFRQLVDGQRAIRTNSRIDGWLWCSGIALSLLGSIHDHLVDFGLVSPPYIAEYAFPLAMVAMGTRYAQRRSLEFVRLRQLQESLARSETKLRDLFESSSDAIFIHDANTGAILEVNRTTCEMWGYSREAFASISVGELSANGSDCSQTLADEHIKKALRVGEVTFPWRGRRRDGSVFPIEVTLKRIELGGKPRVVANVRDLSEREAATNALRQEKTFVTTLLDGLPAIFYLFDEQLTLRRWNRNLERILGYTTEQLEGAKLADLHEPGPKGGELVAAAQHLLEHGQGNTQRQATLRKSDGTPHPCLLTLTRLETADGAVLMGVCTDIAELLQAQADLREGEERYRTLFEGAGEAIFLLEDGKFIDCNASAVDMFGAETRDQLRGRSPLALAPERQTDGTDSLLEGRRRLEATLAGTPQRFEWTHRRLDGTNFLAEVCLNRVDLRGVRHVQAITRDITEKRRLEERLHQAQRLEAIGHLAGGVAHDFNNLLTPIVGNVELLLADLPDKDPSRADLEQVLSAAHRACRLTQQLLTVGRRKVLDVQPVDICMLVVGMKSLLSTLLREDIELDVRVNPKGAIVEADPSQLEQVVMNLVVNGRDAMPSGGRLSVAVFQRELDERTCTQLENCVPGTYAVLTVSDTGVGMSAEVRSRIFNPFFTTKAAGHGTGLGLPTVRGIIQQHRGAMTVTSELDHGSTFTVYLPLVKESTNRLGVDTLPPTALNGTEWVLIVEDDDSVRDFTRRALERHGYRIHSADSAEQALALVETLTFPAQLLVTNVVMPKMNGHDLFHHLRQRWTALRVLYISGYSGDTISHHGILDDGIVLLQKPFSVELLLTKVRGILDA